MIKEEKWPKRGEMVIGTVVRINPFSVFISLEEYDKKEGMVHISEVAGKWVRDIRKFVKLGEKVVAEVMFVDREKKQIGLSLKRVKRYDTEKTMRDYKKKLKAKKMISFLAKNLNMNLEELNEKLINNIEKTFGEDVFDVFQMSLTPQGYDLLIKKGIEENWANAIRAVAQEQLEIKETIIKKIIELKCYKPNGINIIKKVLDNAKKENNFEIKYISAPRYSLVLKTKNAKFGERKVKEVAENIIKEIESLGGEGKVE